MECQPMPNCWKGFATMSWNDSGPAARCRIGRRFREGSLAGTSFFRGLASDAREPRLVLPHLGQGGARTRE